MIKNIYILSFFSLAFAFDGAKHNCNQNQLDSLPGLIVDFNRKVRLRNISDQTYSLMMKKLDEAQIAKNSQLGIATDLDYAIPDDLFALAEDVLLHRMRLNYEALADGMNTSDVLEGILNTMG